jgi:hypothetical protein
MPASLGFARQSSRSAWNWIFAVCSANLRAVVAGVEGEIVLKSMKA